MKSLTIALLATLACQSLASVAVFTPAVLAPVASGDIGVAATAIGIFSAIIYLLASLSAPIGGTFVSRYGAVRVSQFAMVLTGAGLALCTLAHPAAVIAGAVLIGMGYGPITPASSVLLIERTPDRLRNLIMSIRQTGVPVGGALAGAVVPWLVISVGWRGAVLAMSGLILLLVVALQAIRADYDQARVMTAARRPPLASMYRMVMNHEELRRVSLASFTYSGVQMCFASYLVVFLAENIGFSVIDAGVALSAAMIAGIAGRLLWGLAADWCGNARAILALLGGVMTVCALLMALVTQAWPFGAVLLVCAVYGASVIGWNGVYIAEIARVAPEGNVAIATGASLAVTYLGAVVSPFLFWLIVSQTGSYAAAFGLAALATLAAAVTLMRKPPGLPAATG
ncbi:MAG: MFS transporter [Burkholderiales bacterium]|nr:MFS transporter [Burkholderiales bacterium]